MSYLIKFVVAYSGWAVSSGYSS